MHSRLGPLLLRCGALRAEQWNEIVARQAANQAEPLPARIIDSGALAETDLLEHLRRECGLPVLHPDTTPIAPEILALVPAALAQRHHVIPMELSGGSVIIAMADPTDLSVIDELKFVTRYDVRPALAAVSSISTALARYYAPRTAPAPARAPTLRSVPEPTVLMEGAQTPTEDAPVIRLVHAILAEAIQCGASDVHIEPHSTALRVRYRCDGLLREVLRPPPQLKNAIGSRIKILGDLDIAERRLPQDGRLKLPLAEGAAVDVRISILPTLHGEKTVLRILDQRRVRLDLGGLGFDPQQLAGVRQALQRPHGMILVTGPTGSGKSTTLYAALEELNRESRNVLTAEDPVELEIAGVNQVQINEDIGFSFAAALRAFLRQDPDVIMVGEIRDPDTAAIAVKAALTGHLVLSTLHTNDTAASITRLVNMGIEPYLVAASLALVIAQRLVRRNCETCREPEPLADTLLARLGPTTHLVQPLVPTRGRGCPTCKDTGYKGRLALYEICPVSDALRRLIVRGASEAEIRDVAYAEGARSLRDSGLQRVHEGLTSIEEILRATL